MALTKSSTDVAKALVDLFQRSTDTLGLATPSDVYYGDETKIPRYPSITVQPGTQVRNFVATGMQVGIEFEIIIMMYHSALASPSDLTEDSDESTDTLVDLLDTNRNLGGIIINGLVKSIEPGVANVSGGLARASRLTYTALSKVHI